MREHWSTETTPPTQRPRRLPRGWRALPARREPPRREREIEESYSERELLARYLREAGKIPLLTPAAEAELFRQIEEGDADERREARAAMIAANLRLVVGVARHYVGLGLTLPELIAEGNLGLI